MRFWRLGSLSLDEAITASVVTYAKERDEYLGQLEQERAEEAKRVQQRLEEQSAQLQEADRRKDEFLAMLAHELRNPLAPVQNAIEFLRLKCPPDSDLQYSREVIERQVEHLTHIVDDLLDVSRISQGKIKLQLEAVAVAAAVQGTCAEIVAPLIEHRKHKLSITLPREPVA